MVGSTAKSRILIDNDPCRLTLWSFEPGDETGWHFSEKNYVVMPRKEGNVKLLYTNGTEGIANLSPNAPYFRQAEENHNVENAGDGPLSFFEMEFKSRDTS